MTHSVLSLWLSPWLSPWLKQNEGVTWFTVPPALWLLSPRLLWWAPPPPPLSLSLTPLDPTPSASTQPALSPIPGRRRWHRAWPPSAAAAAAGRVGAGGSARRPQASAACPARPPSGVPHASPWLPLPPAAAPAGELPPAWLPHPVAAPAAPPPLPEQPRQPRGPWVEAHRSRWRLLRPRPRGLAPPRRWPRSPPAAPQHSAEPPA